MKLVQVAALLTLSIHLLVTVTRSFYKQQVEEEEKLEQEEEKLEQEEEQVGPSWAELDSNLLGEIASRLCVTHQARFRVVCRNWLAAAHPIINNNLSLSSSLSLSLPWYGRMNPRTCEFRIYDPLGIASPIAISLRKVVKELGIVVPAYVYLHTVKHNWLLFSVSKPKLFLWTRRHVWLLSALTKRIITLPTFDYPSGFDFDAVFSSPPDSPDCVVCMVGDCQDDRIAVLTYRNGDKEWTARQFSWHPDFEPSATFLPHILRGMLYILSPLGQVASYNIRNGVFNFDCLFQDEFLVQNSCSREFRSFVLNGKLMILCFNPDVKKDATLPGQQFVRMYDPTFEVWVPVRTLGDYTLFFSEKLIEVSLINTKDRTCNGVLSNKVYRIFNGGCLVYSIENGQLVLFKSINLNLLEDGRDGLPERKYGYVIPDASVAFWLEAPRVRSSDKQEVRSFRDAGKQGTVRVLGR